jgi:hypothetical protein
VEQRPARAKKNYRPAQVVFDYATQRRTSEQIKADEAKAKVNATAAKSDAVALRRSQLDRCAAIEDAMQAAENLRSQHETRPDLHLKSASNTDMEALSDSRPTPNEPLDALSGHSSVVERRSSYRGSSHSQEFLTGWGEPECKAAVVEDEVEEQVEGEYEEDDEYEDKAELSHSDTEASGVRTQIGKQAKPKKTRREERGKFRAAVNDARKVLPPPPPQSNKRKAPDPPPPVNDNVSTKRTKASEPGGLVTNWKKHVGLLDDIARKNPIEFIDSDDAVEGEFDKPEDPEVMSAVWASKFGKPKPGPTLVSNLVILHRALAYLQLYAAWRQIQANSYLSKPTTTRCWSP